MTKTIQSNNCVTFSKTKESFGGFSNMSTEYPIVVKGVEFSSESNPMLLHATGLQMDCLKRLCRFASAGDEAQTLLSALLLCDAFLPFDHWLEDGSLTGKHDKLTELARRHPETHALLGDSTERIPLQELEKHLKAGELGYLGENRMTDHAGHHNFIRESLSLAPFHSKNKLSTG